MEFVYTKIFLVLFLTVSKKLQYCSVFMGPHQKISRKMNVTCISRMYVDVHEARHVTVCYIPTHTGHKPDCTELKFLPLPESTKEEVSLKLSQGIPTKRILQGTYRTT